MKNKNLSSQVSIYFLISETVLSVFVILVGYYYVRYSVFESYRYRLQYDVQEVLSDLQNSKEEAVRFTENLASDYPRGLPVKNPRRYLEMAFIANSNMSAIGMITSETKNRTPRKSDFFLYRSGAMIKSDAGRFNSNNVKTNDWIEQMLNASKPEWSPPYYNTEIGSRMITYARPLKYSKDGKSLHATIFYSVSLDRSLNNLRHQKMIKSGFSIILDQQNLIVYHPDSSETGKNANTLFKYLGGSSLDISKLLRERISGYQIIPSNYIKNKLSAAIYWPVKSSNWFIITVIPVRLFMSELKRITFALILLTLFIGSITAAVTIYFSIRLVSPITVLADDSRKIMEEEGVDPLLRLNDPEILSDSETIWRLSKMYPPSHLNDLEVLSGNMEKMKERLAVYRKNSLQNSLD